jgi:hypothetical protein
MTAVSNASADGEQAQIKQLLNTLIEAEYAHEDVAKALGRALERAMKAGDYLLAARKLAPPGQWEHYLALRTSISERTARVYCQLAKNRAVLEERQSSAARGYLSIAEALKILKELVEPTVRQKKPAKPATGTVAELVALLRKASDAEVTEALTVYGFDAFLKVMPNSWRPQLARRARATPAGNKREQALTAAVKTALSLAKGDSPNGVINAIKGLRNLLIAEGLDPDSIERVTIEAVRVEKEARRAA